MASPDGIIDLTDGPPTSLKAVRKRLKENETPVDQNKKIKSEPSQKINYDDVQVLPAVPLEAVPAAAAAPTVTGGDIEVVGTKNHVDLPHMRQHCTVKLVANGASAFCESCYCYVCDVKASECQRWTSHCQATDRGDKAYHWRDLRAKAKKDPSVKAAVPTAPALSTEQSANNANVPHMRQYCRSNPMKLGAPKFCDNCICYVCDVKASQCQHWGSHCLAKDRGFQAHYWRKLRDKTQKEASVEVAPAPSLMDITRFSHEKGPFPPTHELASKDKELTQCRHCQWYNRFGHQNYKFLSSPMAKIREPRTDWETRGYVRYYEMHPIGSLDWCHACGRIPDARDLGKEQGKEYTPTANVVHLGTKTMEFTLHPHDPRKMSHFSARWTQNPEWTYDQTTMLQELFAHRLGDRPHLARVLASVPTTLSKKTSNDVDAILFENEQEFATLLDLYRSSSSFGLGTSDAYFRGDLKACWDSRLQKGTLTVRLFVDPSQSRRQNPVPLARFIGNWFGVFPLKLSELPLTLKATLLDISGSNNQYKDREAEINTQLNSINGQYEKSLESLSLESSTGSHFFGGTSPANADFLSVLRRYVAEITPDLLHQMRGYDCPTSWILENPYQLWKSHWEGMVRDHCGPDTGHGFDSMLGHRNFSYAMDTFFSPRDFLLAQSLAADASERRDKIHSLQALMNHMECRGHEQAQYVDGLTVDLLPFQLQTLQWATERETIAGGVQSFFWCKLPSLDPPMYYSPVLGRISRSKPNLVRGGIIAEQMGLGKTVISLALILRNPAPVLPLSGSSVSAIPSVPPAETDQPFWDPVLQARSKATTHDKRGSIVSRGTLVVCNVSLVGQWIDEAKSKLKNPGLVYSYHGHSRKRDPLVLAQNSIVVTTYETLASDATFHRTKSNDPDIYCAPCEQVRWWRIICDESHSLRNTNVKKARAVLDLVADNKWLVSGTPVNTSLNDLQNQLRFLDIEHCTDFMEIVQESTCIAIGDRQSKRSRYGMPSGPAFGSFTFLMRSIMMRHAQEQRYTGTNTTLMSLPRKTERVVKVKFTGNDAVEYARLDASTRQYYESFKESHPHELKKHYLRLMQKLMPLRTACAGGQIPLDDDFGGDDDSSNGEDGDGAKKKGRKPVKFSEYAYTSKLKKLIEELERVRAEDPTSKSLVFSQFTSTLKWLQAELPRHGFQFRTLSGDMSMSKRAKALSDFQKDPPTTIFLLSMRAGAVGINLTQANRVFLMEPCFNPALEAQAIGRVHRLGQTRPVQITRLIMSDSIETRMQAFLEHKYGKQQSSSSEADSDQDKKPSAAGTPAATAIVGSLKTDKVNLDSHEFDLLYGVTDSIKAEPVTDEALMADTLDDWAQETMAL